MYIGDPLVRQLEELIMGGSPKKTWIEAVRNYLKSLNLNDKIALDRNEWKHKIHVGDLN